MRLSVPLVRQSRRSMECGLACVCMLLRYHGIPASLAALRHARPVDDHGLYTGELGCLLLELGFGVRVILMQPRLFTLADTGISAPRVRRRLARFAQDTRNAVRDREAATRLLDFIRAGGAVEIRVPTINDVTTELHAGRPVIASLSAHFLSARTPAFTFHYTVVTGRTRGRLFCNDPSWNRTGGRRAHDIEAFFYGIAATAYHQLDEPCLILARPPRQTALVDRRPSETPGRQANRS